MKILPKAIIVDIDGTLAKMNGRKPFEWHRVGEDLVHEAIKDLVNKMHKHYQVIIFSGRDGVCRTETINWLIEHSIIYDKIFMRKEGDNRKDAIIKRELFDTFIKDQYDIQFVLDDRDQVVSMWRIDLGLVCLQVAYGDF